MAYLIAHASEILQIVTGVVTVASLVANLTPTKSDNAVIDKISSLIHSLALNFNVK